MGINNLDILYFLSHTFFVYYIVDKYVILDAAYNSMLVKLHTSV